MARRSKGSVDHAGSRVLALLLVAVSILLVACRADETLELRAWTLRAHDGSETAIMLPTHVDSLVARGSTYTLHTEVTVPEAWRGKPLTLAIPFLEARTTLSVDGVDAAPLEESVLPGHPSLSAHSFRVDPARAQDGTLDLALTVEADTRRARWLDTVPRLSATPHGDVEFLAVRTLNGPVVLASFAVISTIGFTYLALHFFDRRRKAHGWFVWHAMGAAYYLLELLGVPQVLFGPHLIGISVVTASAICGLYFLHAYQGLSQPSRGFSALFVAPVAVALFGSDGHPAGTVLLILVEAFVVACVARVMWRLHRDGRDHFGHGHLATAWALLVVLSPTDLVRASGRGELAGGAHLTVLAFGVFCVVQAALLGRDHVGSLKSTDALNAELKSRIALLEERAVENARLSEELRRQIADRSQRLAEALARIGEVPERVVSLRPGDEVHGRYRAVKPLGAGGMGAVYEVERVSDGRRLALKVLTSATTGVALARLAREAQVAAQLSHENLVGIVDVDVSDAGALYLVMELVEGSPLHELRDRYGDAPWARAMLVQIARGLAALHARGVVHRDLKPANVFVTTEGVAKIGDFGIARMGAETSDVSIASGDLGSAPTEAVVGNGALAPTEAVVSDGALTATGVIMGTPLYMAPELAGGAKFAGPASDVFAFGVLAHELWTGRLPFAVPAIFEAMAGRSVGRPPGLGNGTKSGEMVAEAMLSRCLEAEPGKRPTAAEIAAALGE